MFLFSKVIFYFDEFGCNFIRFDLNEISLFYTENAIRSGFAHEMVGICSRSINPVPSREYYLPMCKIINCLPIGGFSCRASSSKKKTP